MKLQTTASRPCRLYIRGNDLDHAGDLVSQHTGHRERDLPLDNVQVGVADTTGRDLDQHLPSPGLRPGHLLHPEVPSDF